MIIRGKPSLDNRKEGCA